MTMTSKRTTALLGAGGLIGLLLGASLYERHNGPPAPGRGAMQPHALPSALVSAPSPSEREPYGDSGARARARARLQLCLSTVQRTSQTSWDGMCTSLAQHTAQQREDCRQQGGSAASCLSSYAATPPHDCLLPHATAISIAQSEQSAKGDCYQQFQAEMR